MTSPKPSSTMSEELKQQPVNDECEEDTSYFSVSDAFNEEVSSSTTRRVPTSFVAMEFHHANENPGSICAIGITIVDRGNIVSSKRHLVKPYTHLRKFDEKHSSFHGIKLEDVESAPLLHEILKEVYSFSERSKLVVFDARTKAVMMEEAFGAGRLVPRNVQLRCLFEMAMDSDELKTKTLHSLARGLSVAARDISDPLKEAENYLVASMSQKVENPTTLAKAMSMNPPVQGDVASESLTVAELYLAMFEDEKHSRQFDCDVFGRADKRNNRVSLHTVFKGKWSFPVYRCISHNGLAGHAITFNLVYADF